MWWKGSGMTEPFDMVTIPAGHFVMGTAGEDRFANSTEGPAHEMVIERAFKVARFPVTERQWREFCGTGPDSLLPVEQVSWHDAADFALWLASRTGRAFRLLTEVEREYA
ncbi:MAG: hypothetical protein JWO08_3914 [Verrucomicrobiaceae bacterium]|nr:hypothetical protein [Verrucomicrobiaceae bacterium]